MRKGFPGRSRRRARLFIRVFVLLQGIAWVSLLCPPPGQGKLFIDINAPSVRRLRIAVPDFRNLSAKEVQPELAAELPRVVTEDLETSGYFAAMDKEAFLAEETEGETLAKIDFKSWSVIGAELLLKGRYTCIGRSLEVEIRLFDVFLGRQILGKRVLGDISGRRRLMHRISNQIIRTLTGREGVFLSKIAFVSNTTGHKEIYVSDYDGHNVRQLTFDKNIAQLPRWSPDGKKLLYNSYKDGGTHLYLRDMTSGSLRRISFREGLNIGAAWAPDGRHFALTLSPGGDPDIFLLNLEGKIVKQLTDHWGIDVSPTFSPDGKKIAFVSNRSGSPQIYVANLDEGTQERITFEGNYNTSPAWSVLDRIAFTSMNGGRFDIASVAPEGGPVRWLTQEQGNNEDPNWSPDGRYVVFSSNRSGAYHLYLMDANGQGQRRITSLKGDQISPSWAP